eukprot:TRINITY_DN2771_c0_g2_i3.p1 TRINITY_DN2771_c0_g2~~TRINITY_DN2771_c0_g2_i3.p1  ORF type:complete len:147 (+),score=9.28 TRINITY_DN2771_c0_g2_i3:582-1022(+)
MLNACIAASSSLWPPCASAAQAAPSSCTAQSCAAESDEENQNSQVGICNHGFVIVCFRCKNSEASFGKESMVTTIVHSPCAEGGEGMLGDDIKASSIVELWCFGVLSMYPPVAISTVPVKDKCCDTNKCLIEWEVCACLIPCVECR